MFEVGHPPEVSVDEPLCVLTARSGGVGDLHDQIVTDLEALAGGDPGPIEPGDGQILAGGSRSDRMSFALEHLDYLQRVEAQGLIGPAMMFSVSLIIAFHAAETDPGSING